MTLASQNPDIYNFLERNHVAVLATADKNGEPHAATIYFAIDFELNIYFVTKSKTAKSRNLEANPIAAMAVYEQEAQRTAQISGGVVRITDKTAAERALSIMAKISKKTSGTDVLPISKLEAGEYILYELTPQSIRLGEYKYGVHNELFKVAVKSEDSLE